MPSSVFHYAIAVFAAPLFCAAGMPPANRLSAADPVPAAKAPLATKNSDAAKASDSSKTPAAAEIRPPLSKLPVADGDSLVFLGDSITHQCLYTQYVESYFYTRFPKLRLKFHNSGVGGDRCLDALLRFEDDVARYKPKYVFVLLGMNDGGVRPFDAPTFETYRADMRRLLEKIVGIGATPVLMTPTMFDARASRASPRPRAADVLEQYNALLAYYGGWIREEAVERGFGFVDMYSPLNNLTLARRKVEPAFTMIRDGVHPDAPGQLVMAYSLLYDLGLPRSVATMRIDRGGAHGVGAKISDSRYTDDGLEFTALADALPMAVTAGAEAGAKLLNFGHRMGREALEVHGLELGEYELRIDDEPVGRYASAALEHGIELQANDKTPQYRQALAVAELNRRRNDEAIRPLRGVWRERKVLRLAEARLAATPDDEPTKRQIAELKKTAPTADARIAEFEQAARTIEDEIFQINGPKSHRYRLVRVP